MSRFGRLKKDVLQVPGLGRLRFRSRSKGRPASEARAETPDTTQPQNNGRDDDPSPEKPLAHETDEEEEDDALSAVSRELWAEAYESLKGDEDSRKLLTTYQNRLIRQGNNGVLDDDQDNPPDGPDQEGGVEQVLQIQKLAKDKMDALPETYTSFEVKGRKIVLRHALRTVIDAVVTFKEIISTAISSQPHASLAWAGILAVIPVRESQTTLPGILVPRQVGCCVG